MKLWEKILLAGVGLLSVAQVFAAPVFYVQEPRFLHESSSRALLIGTAGTPGPQGERGYSGAQGPAGPAGADGPNNITTATTTSITGILKGDGSTVSAATSQDDIPGLSTIDAPTFDALKVYNFFNVNNSSSVGIGIGDINGNLTTTAESAIALGSVSSITALSNNTTYKNISSEPTYNIGSRANTKLYDLYINRIETSLGATPSTQRLISLNVGGVEKFGVDNTGAVFSNGIHSVPAGGTTGQKLVKTADTDYATGWSTDTDAYLPLSGGIIKPTADSTTTLQVQKADATPVINVDTTNGRVGIGTTTPAGKLDIQGTTTNSPTTYPLIVRDSGETVKFSVADNGDVLNTGTTRVKAITNGAGTLKVQDSSAVTKMDMNTSTGVLTLAGTAATDASTATITRAGGAALGEVTFAGTYGGLYPKTIVVKIDAIGTPDTFSVSVDNGATWLATGRSCSTSAYSILYTGLSVTWASTTGHAVNQTWSIQVAPPSSSVYTGNSIGLGGTDKFINTSLQMDVAIGGSLGLYRPFTRNNYAGRFNVAIGNNAAYNSTTTTNSIVAIGQNAMAGGSAGLVASNVVALGATTFFNATILSESIAIGTGAGQSLASGNLTQAAQSIFIGGSTKGAVDNQTNEIVVGYGAIGNGTNTTTIGNASTTATILKGSISGPKARMTATGGFAVLLTNNTGSTIGQGYVVTASPNHEMSIIPNPVDVPTPIGCMESSCTTGSDCWVVTSGIGYCYFTGSTTRGQFARTMITGDTSPVAGVAIAEAAPTAPFTDAKHFSEIGHVLETRTGAGIARVAIHQL